MATDPGMEPLHRVSPLNRLFSSPCLPEPHAMCHDVVGEVRKNRINHISGFPLQTPPQLASFRTDVLNESAKGKNLTLRSSWRSWRLGERTGFGCGLRVWPPAPAVRPPSRHLQEDVSRSPYVTQKSKLRQKFLARTKFRATSPGSLSGVTALWSTTLVGCAVHTFPESGTEHPKEDRAGLAFPNVSAVPARSFRHSAPTNSRRLRRDSVLPWDFDLLLLQMLHDSINKLRCDSWTW
jgi:hypothetical protein